MRSRKLHDSALGVTAEPLPKAADAEPLTFALRRAGVLGRSRVCNVVVESSFPAAVSRVVRLRLAYEPADEGAPRSVVFKTARPESVGRESIGGRQEVAFYAQVAPAMSARVVPRCFDAQWNEETEDWHLVLEDLSESHCSPTAWPLPPTMEQCGSILGTLARFHAEWWDDPRLGVSIGTWLDATTLDQQLQGFSERFAAFTDRLGERLSGERRDLYRRLLDRVPRLYARYHAHRNVTLVHGDAHFWNILLPKAEGSDDIRIFDWSAWRTGIPSNDLAYMMAMHWYPDLRRRREKLLLDRYHAALLAHGVRSYTRRSLDDDYRLSVLLQILTPVLQEAFGIPPWTWWNNLERILLAVDDLGCRELLA